MMTQARFDEILNRFDDISVAVVGDYFLDKYLIIDAELTEPSVETGLDAHQVIGKRISPGAAGTVVANLHALGVGLIKSIGVTGCDGEGFELRQALQHWDIDMNGLLEAPGTFTPTYTKPMLRHGDGIEEELNRIDIRNRRPPAEWMNERLASKIRACVSDVDGIIVADQVPESELASSQPGSGSSSVASAPGGPTCRYLWIRAPMSASSPASSSSRMPWKGHALPVSSCAVRPVSRRSRRLLRRSRTAPAALSISHSVIRALACVTASVSCIFPDMK